MIAGNAKAFLVFICVRKERCMPEEFTWGPARLKKTPDGTGVFFTDTPQVFLWAYIFKRSLSILPKWGFRVSGYYLVRDFFQYYLQAYILTTKIHRYNNYKCAFINVF